MLKLYQTDHLISYGPESLSHMISLPFFINLSLFLNLAALSLWDLKKGILPDILLILLAFLAFISFEIPHIESAVILGILGYGLYKLYPLLKKQEGLGLGDVKMMAVCGLWLTPTDIPLFLILGGGIGLLIAIFWRFIYKNLTFPLGPALAIALGICIFSNTNQAFGELTMSPTFSGPSIVPAQGTKPNSLVVIIHGYGADGENLLPLGKAWASLLPNTVFVSPHGPVICEVNPFGKQWFSLKEWTPSQNLEEFQTQILEEIQAITPTFQKYLDDLLKQYDIPSEKLALVGFSQGAALALHMGLHRPECAGIVAYSGGYISDPQHANTAHPPVLLIHGTEDQVLLSSQSEMAEKKLKAMGIPVTLCLLPYLDHEIDERGLKLGATFLREKLYQ